MPENQNAEAVSQVVASQAMIPPQMQKMFERRAYVTLPDAPATHARLCVSKEAGNAFCLQFNGADLITMRFPAGIRPHLRAHSDGDFQSQPFIQQFQMSLDREAEVEVAFASPVEMWNMRPRRAERGEAILGQIGRPLMYSVNGMYLPDWDLLISWHGLPFAWKEQTIREAEGRFSAEMILKAGRKPWVVLIRPHYYSEHLGYATYQPRTFRPNPRAVTGWCSWEAYHDQITQEDLRRTAEALRPLKDYGLRYIQLDDGYQNPMVPPAPGHDIPESWLKTNERFPGGHEAIVAAVREAGFEPGIWTNAAVTNEAAAAEANCIRHPDGSLMRGDWIQYTMDCTDETLARQVTPYYRAFRELGYTYVKSDALRHLIYDGLQEAVRFGLMDAETARRRHRAYLEAARAALGRDVYYLSCWGVLTSSIGLCDAMRVATDANPSWSAYSMQLRETARWYFAQRVMFTVDPDHVCVRAEPAWARMMLSFVSLTGGLFMVSDKVESYDPQRFEMMKKTMPGLDTRAAETGPVDYTTPACARMPKDLPAEEASRLIAHTEDEEAPFASLWSIHFDRGGRQWTVVQRCAVIPLQPVSVPLEKLALDPGKRYYAFDFWKQEGREIAGGALELDALALGDTSVIALTAITEGEAGVVASNRHVSMDAVSITEQHLSGSGLHLELKGFKGLKTVYWIWPGSLAGEITAHSSCETALRRAGDLLRLDVSFSGVNAEVTVR